MSVCRRRHANASPQRSAERGSAGLHRGGGVAAAEAAGFIKLSTKRSLPRDRGVSVWGAPRVRLLGKKNNRRAWLSVASVKVATLTDATWARPFRNYLAVSGGFRMFWRF